MVYDCFFFTEFFFRNFHGIPPTTQARCRLESLIYIVNRQLFEACYTPGSSNIAVAGKWGPRVESMYFLLKMGMSFQQSLCDRLPEVFQRFSSGALGYFWWFAAPVFY